MKACFMGLGYIGLPTAIVAADNSIDVTGVDINPQESDVYLIVNEVSLLLDDNRYYGAMAQANNPYRDGLACEGIIEFVK